MKILMLSLVVMLSVSSCTQKKEYLFNGKNLKNWTIYLEDETINPEDFFYVKDGVIETPGVPVGYIRTNKTYSNYHLHIEWCYPEEPTNSGVFLHTNIPDKIWIAHYQAQLKHKNAGDFIVHGVGVSATVGDSVCVSTEEVKPLIAKLHESNENEAGEWNSYDIYCKGDSIEIKVNGLLQNVATHCSLTEGCIGMQAEGSKIQFRNIWIEKI
ncbi:MAG: DUF1080 domain-containing protein [Bacteroidales bacterium]|nr:DUF1080 domain-containing protein [Bacteroidales bacterium]MCF8390089.1 DUF1080 domain-containing protein [Bacteroidales bacterium]